MQTLTTVPQQVDYFFESEVDLETLLAACECEPTEGQSIVFTLEDQRRVACFEHAPIYYANPEANCDQCGAKAVITYWHENARVNRCRVDANVYTNDDFDLLRFVIAYDDESEMFETSWDERTGWDLDAMAQFLRGFAMPAKSRSNEEAQKDEPAPLAVTVDPSSYRNRIFNHTALNMSELPDGSIDACITSPPYFGHRNYDGENQIGLERDKETYIANLLDVFREVRRVLRPTGTAWIVLGDSYASKWACNRGSGHKIGAGACPPEQRQNRLSGDLKEMDLMMVPHEFAWALRKDGWILRDLVVWGKAHPRPEPRKNRRLTTAHEIVIRVAKQHDYYFDVEALERVKMRDNVWMIDTVRKTFGHPAAYPAQLVAGALISSVPKGGIVLDPFIGSGTTAVVAEAFGCDWVGYDTSGEYIKTALDRVKNHALIAEDLPAAFRPLLDPARQPLALF